MSEWVYESEVVIQILGSPQHYYPELVWKLAASAASQHARADYEHALLAQRDAELEALRGKISEAEEWLREDEDNCGNCHYAAQMAVAAANDGLASMPAYAPSCDFHEGAHRLLSALSDNPESPALTDKEV